MHQNDGQCDGLICNSQRIESTNRTFTLRGGVAMLTLLATTVTGGRATGLPT
eukprot:gene16430-biopygen5259